MSIADLFNPKNNAATAAAALAMQAANMKKGKSFDQCKCIDFLLGVPEEGDQKKKGGCMKGGKTGWTIEDYNRHVQGLVDSLDLKNRAIRKIGLDESQISEIPPILLTSYSRKGDGIYTKWEGSKYVTNKYSVTWIFFSATQLYTYTYVLDTISDDSVETTRDFFYSDITCIRTEHEIEERIYEVNDKGCLAQIKALFKPTEAKYVHNNIHWDTLQITVPNDSYSFCCRTNDLASMEQSIQAAKAMIREKKQA